MKRKPQIGDYYSLEIYNKKRIIFEIIEERELVYCVKIIDDPRILEQQLSLNLNTNVVTSKALFQEDAVKYEPGLQGLKMIDEFLKS